ncbi:DUF2779 domain-containing protein [Rhodohalobacter halophilus]|uniref:DUF2779 domain-containing protein n=1 Tax=Rhodohalobacter halophilus TaxID=1812810 RepID=UPI00083F8ED6|nr:DUF2779 domain-containing protein [Rhodohalobacter halophilus]
MGNSEINDSLFLKSISCPLKFHFVRSGFHNRKPYLPFKQRNKLLLRDILASKYADAIQTSDSVQEAIKETDKLLERDSVTICGAVVKWGDFVTRIPLLSKRGNVYTIVQIHGKLRRRQHGGVVPVPPLSKSTEGYLVKAAYRMAILQKALMPDDCKVEFFFPDKRYRSGFDNLLLDLKSNQKNSDREKLRDEIDHLFTSMDATAATEAAIIAIPESIAHHQIAGRSIYDVLTDLSEGNFSHPNSLNVTPHEECGRCEFRGEGSDSEARCWNSYFDGDRKSFPEKHVFDLIGHGNQQLLSEEKYFQEDCPLPDEATSFDKLRKNNPRAITIQQRRELQLLKAHHKKIPDVWLKSNALGFDQILYPLHFIDFEAATYAIPMKRGMGAYSPVYFQFSCHTLYESGEIVHAEWLDDRADSGYPHLEFIHQLGKVDSIFDGNLIQYSPFESQALRFLLQEMERNSMLYSKEIDILKRLLYKDGEHHNHRIFDLSRSVREGYYNKFMDGSIGLKQILQSVFKLKVLSGQSGQSVANIYDREVDFSKVNHQTNFDPYSLLQHSTYKIDDGEAAMNAYISLKTGRLSKEESAEIPTLLRRYCAMDSYALFIIYEHLLELMRNSSNYENAVIE